MPKMRSHKGAKKRFHVTASGEVKRGQAGNRHLAPGNTQKQTRQIRKSALVSAPDKRHLKQILSNIQ